MSETMNKQIRLASRPSGWVTEDNFTLSEGGLPEPGEGQLLVTGKQIVQLGAE